MERNQVFATARKTKKIFHEYFLSTTHLEVVAKIFTYQKGYEVSKEIKSKIYSLNPISLKELLILRATSTKPGFILKIRNNYYYAQIPKNLRLFSQYVTFNGPVNSEACPHLCGRNCNYLSPAEDNEGGCAKVRDLSFRTLYDDDALPFEDALMKCQRIEKYPFITFGFETINTIYDVINVIYCDRYEHVPSNRNLF